MALRATPPAWQVGLGRLDRVESSNERWSSGPWKQVRKTGRRHSRSDRRRQIEKVKRRLLQPKGAGGRLCGCSRFVARLVSASWRREVEGRRRDALSCSPPRGRVRGTAGEISGATVTQREAGAANRCTTASGCSATSAHEDRPERAVGRRGRRRARRRETPTDGLMSFRLRQMMPMRPTGESPRTETADGVQRLK